jgi:creatinine amidohydrolase
MDTLVVVRILDLLEREMDLVVLPPFYYGAASYGVAGPDRNGTVQVDSPGLLPFARALFQGLLRVGFRNIHGVIHHQSENFAAGMPTDLAFKLAAREVIFEALRAERGEGWWGDSSMADYYTRHEQGDNPFNWIRFHPLMDAETQQAYTFDHAGIGETSLMMSLCPEGVDMDHFSEDAWYSRTAKDATAEYGDTAKKRILTHLRSALTGGA